LSRQGFLWLWLHCTYRQVPDFSAGVILPSRAGAVAPFSMIVTTIRTSPTNIAFVSSSQTIEALTYSDDVSRNRFVETCADRRCKCQSDIPSHLITPGSESSSCFGSSWLSSFAVKLGPLASATWLPKSVWSLFFSRASRLRNR